MHPTDVSQTTLSTPIATAHMAYVSDRGDRHLFRFVSITCQDMNPRCEWNVADHDHVACHTLARRVMPFPFGCSTFVEKVRQSHGLRGQLCDVEY